MWPVEALVLVVDPANGASIDPAGTAEALGLTGMESRVAVLLAQGMSVREIAAAMSRKERTIRPHVKQTLAKQGYSHQAELARVILALADAPTAQH